MIFRRILTLAAATLLSLCPLAGMAQDKLEWHGGTATIGELKYKDGFARFDYVNPDAPKGGTLDLTTFGTFDTLNPLLAKGDVGAGVAGLAFETLMKPSMDEIASDYGLLAEAIAYPDDFAFVKFRLRAEAKWADGKPVTP
jgi:microcin C transport system substrate-binding protein